MRLRRRALSKVAHLGPQGRRATAASIRLAARLNDASGDLAVGIALLKGWKESGGGPLAEPAFTIGVFEQALTELRELTQAASDPGRARRHPASVRESLEEAAHTAGVDLELKLIGQQGSLPQAQAELIYLIGREAMRNMSRQSGGSRCRIAIDLDSCPYVLTVRDWRAGIQPESPRGGGIALLEALADEMGGALRVSPQADLGVELVLTGPCCARTRHADHGHHSGDDPSPVVAEESLGSRKRVAARRPIGALGQQIT